MAAAPLLQMVCENGTAASGAAAARGLRNWERNTSPIELTALTKPGPFGRRTREFGTYLAIRMNGKLVAMAGERLKVPGHSEVSAVCTHPEHRGKGYAAALMMEVMKGIREPGRNSLLTRQTGQRARDRDLQEAGISGEGAAALRAAEAIRRIVDRNVAGNVCAKDLS